MKTFCRYLFLALLLMMHLPIVFAQENTPLNTSVAWSCLTIDKGLSSNTVRALLQDRKGFVWVGTSRGLNRYDGHRMVPLYKTRSFSVTSMAEWGDSIWVGTDNGLYLYLQRLDSIRRYAVPIAEKSQKSLNVADLKMDKSGCLWMATMGQGILCLNVQGGQVTAVPTPHDDKSYGCICIDRRGDVWASSNWAQSNLLRYNWQKKCFENFPLQFAKETDALVAGIAMTEDASGKMWLGAWDGAMIRFDAATHQAEVVFTPFESQMQHIHSVLPIAEHTLLVGSDRGLAVMDAQTRQVRLHHRNSSITSSAISDNFVYPLMVDREGGTWIGTYYGGVNYTHPVSGNFTSYTHSPHDNSVSGNVVNHFCEDQQHRLTASGIDRCRGRRRMDPDYMASVPLL